MLKKVIGFNGSPRKGMNTDLLVQKALEGARSLGAQTKLIEISDLKHVQPCISCLHCKKNKNTEGRCVLKDDLTPVLKELKDVDALVIGTPVYWGYFSGAIHSALERIWFSNWSYNPSRKSVFGKKINTAFIWTMNVKKEVSDQMYSPFYKHTTWVMENVFGKCEKCLVEEIVDHIFIEFWNRVRDADFVNIVFADVDEWVEMVHDERNSLVAEIRTTPIHDFLNVYHRLFDTSYYIFSDCETFSQ